MEIDGADGPSDTVDGSISLLDGGRVDAARGGGESSRDARQKGDDDAQLRPQKRHRQVGPAPIVVGGCGDVVLVDITNGEEGAGAQVGPARSTGAEELLLEDEEELRITGARVEVWNKDLPHMRHECGTHAFANLPQAGNSEACSKCYCFICDQPAAACSFWGDGSSEADHCNAFDNPIYRDQKQKRKHTQKEKQAAAAAAGAQTPAAGTAAAPVPPPAAPEPYLIVGSSLPPPTPDMFKLGEIRLRCRVNSRYTVTMARNRPFSQLGANRSSSSPTTTLRQIDEKLVRHGALQRSRDYSGLVRCDYSDTVRHSLHLDNAFKRDSYYHSSGNEPLELLPPVPPMEVVPPERTVVVVLARWGQSGAAAPPTIYGVEVTTKEGPLKVKGVLARARKEEWWPREEEERLKGGVWLCYTFLQGDDCTLDGCYQMCGYKENSADWLLSCNQALVVVLPGVPTLCRAKLNGCHRAVNLVVQHRDHENQPRICSIRTVLTVDWRTAEGGPDEFELVKRAILDSMSHSEALPELEDIKRSHDYSSRSSFRNSCFLMRGRATDPGGSNLNLTCVWRSGEALDSMEERMTQTQRDPTAAPEALAASKARHNKVQDRKKLEDEAMSKAHKTLSEIVSGARCSAPIRRRKRKNGQIVHEMFQHDKPILRVRLHLEAADDQATEGEAVLGLWAWTTPPPPAAEGRPTHLQLLLKEASCTSEMGLRFDKTSSSSTKDEAEADPPSWARLEAQIPSTLKALTSGVEGLEAAEAELRMWRKKRSSITTPAALLAALETGEVEPAVQPQGLTVTLRPYQLQTLGFMQRSETGEGGFRKNLWFRVPPASPGAPGWWYSPVFKQACLEEPPPCPWGGFLGETMGLGKTVEVLALILSDRPHLPAIPEQASTLYPPGHPGRSRAADKESSASASSAPGAAASAAGAAGPSATSEVPAAAKTPEREGPRVCSNATLVVCAVSLVGQWVKEAQSKTGGSLKIYQYHGQGRTRDEVELATKYDVVVTTYATLSSDWSLKKGGKKGPAAKPEPRQGGAVEAAKAEAEARLGSSPLHRIQWYRLVLDESHSVKDPKVAQAKACAALEASRRWCCSGTPLSNDCGDLLGQFMVLRMPPFSLPAVFGKRYKPLLSAGRITSNKDSRMANDGAPELLYALGRAMVRHTKHQKTGGETVLQLPPLEQSNVEVHLSAEEKAQYLAAHAEADVAYRRIIAGPNGTANASRHLLQIMSLLLPLRRIASGGILSGRDVAVPNLPASVAKIAAEEEARAQAQQPQMVPGLTVPAEMQCSICLDVPERPVRTPCGHWFCQECILASLEQSGASCPLCRSNVDRTALQRACVEEREKKVVVEEEAKAEQDGGSGSASALEEAPAAPVPCESKLQALVSELRAMRARDGSAKALVFSQFMGTIEWLKARLPGEGFGFRYIDGSMAMKKRSKAIADFQGDPPTTVFLLSMRAGAVGINLTAASHVFLLEPALNPALEEQAVGRAWRMGQAREVVVKRLFVKGSVEENIMKLNDRRSRGFVALEASTSSSSAPGGGGGGSTSGPAPSLLPSIAAAASSSGPGQPSAHASGKQKLGGSPEIMGSLHTDKQVLKLEELNLLFAAPSLIAGPAAGVSVAAASVIPAEAG